jgi:hypothetical protein
MFLSSNERASLKEKAMAQSQQKPGSGGTPKKEDDTPAGRTMGVDATPSLPETSVCPASEWEISVELVPLDERTLAQAKSASSGKPSDQAPLDDPEAIVDAALLDRPPPAKASPPPNGMDWLRDLEPPRPPVQSTEPPSNATPDWLAEVAEIEASLRSASRSNLGTSPDWLADIEHLEGLRTPAPLATLEIASASPTQLQTVRVPISPPTPVSSPALTDCNPAHSITPSLATEDLLAKQAIAETGHDPSTGQIFDQDRYEKWHHLRAAAAATEPSAVCTESIGEVYHKARSALARWVDDDNRHTLIMTADLEELRKHPEVQAILAQFELYGPVMREKLVHHVEYLVTNRRKYYTACLK